MFFPYLHIFSHKHWGQPIGFVNNCVYNNIMKTFKHSGAFGDLIYGLPIMKHFGGGEFYLHLNQIDWIGQHYYGSPPNPFHKGRLTLQDYEFMKSFMLAQEYVTKFEVMDPRAHAITHNLDKFRVPFVGHPDNYINIYSSVFGLSPEDSDKVASTPWLTVPEPRKIPGKTAVINRTLRWIPPEPGEAWAELKQQLGDQAVFVGLPEEHQAFEQAMGWRIDYHPAQDMLELASIIAGAEVFVGNQSQCYALAVGLGVPEIWLEARRDMPMARNECYFPKMENVQYF
jgi:hypothetical protein